MSVDFLAKYSSDISKGSLDPVNAGPCFRLGSKPAKYVFFRESGGKHAAFGYFLLQSLAYDPVAGLVLRFGSATVTIKGLNLKLASQSLMDHLVQECCVEDERHGVPAGVPFVTGITIDFK
ncbi:MAG: hypothetical protein IPM64_00055 [Phycisphaerales bacterium]|nr:hypothetical protein [Phycisphaerales bacterium]